MHQNGGIRVRRFQVVQAFGLELFVHDARAVPAQHVSARLVAHIATQVLVRRPQDFFTVAVQVFDQLHCNGGSDNPVSAGFHCSRRIGVNHHRTVRVLVTEGGEFVFRATDIQRTGGFQCRHENALFRAEDLGGLTHELDPGHNQRGRGMVFTETGHLQGVGNTATGFFRQRLDLGICVVVRHQHRITLTQQRLDPVTIGCTLLIAERVVRLHLGQVCLDPCLCLCSHCLTARGFPLISTTWKVNTKNKAGIIPQHQRTAESRSMTRPAMTKMGAWTVLFKPSFKPAGKACRKAGRRDRRPPGVPY